MTSRALWLYAACLCGCTELIPGITVDVLVELEAEIPSRLSNDQGYIIEPTASFIGVAVEALIPCDPEVALDMGAVLRSRSPLELLGVSTAWAHVPTLGPQAGLIHIEDMNSDRSPQLLGALGPAPGRYCAAMLRVGPPPGEAVAALYVEGRYSAPEEARSRSFSLRSFGDAKRIVRFPEPLVLSASQLLGELHISLAYPRWFDGLQLEQAEEALAAQALQNALNAAQGWALSF